MSDTPAVQETADVCLKYSILITAVLKCSQINTYISQHALHRYTSVVGQPVRQTNQQLYLSER